MPCIERRNHEKQQTKRERAHGAEQERAECAERAGKNAGKGERRQGQLFFGRKKLRLFQEHEILQVKRARGGESIRSPYDPEGSYTGVPEEGGVPVQDADDL